MTRIFVPPEAIKSETITLTNDQSRYLALVLRAQPGDTIIIMDGQGCKYDCKLLSVHKKEIVAAILSKAAYSIESPLSITLAQGIVKADKMNFIIQKSTELGVNRIIPLVTERTQVRKTDKIIRWRKIAQSASQQCGRDKVPGIDEPIKFEHYLSSLSQETGPSVSARLIFSEGVSERNLKKTMSCFGNILQLIIMVGPEGGFSEQEVSFAIKQGFSAVSLGPRILRAETAPLSAMSIIQYELGDMF